MGGRIVRVLTALALGVGTMAVAGPARATDEVAPVVLWPSSAADCKNRAKTDCGMLTLTALVDPAAVPAGSTLQLDVRGCGGDTDVRDTFAAQDAPWLPSVGTPFALDGARIEDGSYRTHYSFWTRYPGETFHLGPDWSATLTLTRPGMAPWVLAFDHATPVAGDTFGIFTDGLVCPADDRDVSAVVSSWSRLRGRPVIGRTVRVTPTRLDPVAAQIGARVSYTWYAGAQVVSRTRVLKVRRPHVGKVIKVRYQVTAPGKKTAGATATVGVARSRR
jgi:hypothetical protein